MASTESHHEGRTRIAHLTAGGNNGLQRSDKQSGRLDGWGTFHLHGVGCLVELDTGEEVDFDWDAEGCPIFDGWRLRQFARSAGEEGVSQESLVAVARQLVGTGVLDETPDGWFRLPTAGTA